MSKNILLLESVAPEAYRLLEEDETVRVFPVYETSSETAGTVAAAHDIHAIITRGKGDVSEALIATCRSLRVIARCGVGLDNVDVKAATSHGIKVVNAPGINASTIAEHTLSLMLMLVRNLYPSVTNVKDGNWQWRNQYTGDELSGKTLGILGLGNIGRRVARLAEAFGMDIIYWDKFTDDKEYRRRSLEEVLSTADVVTVHVPLLPDTEGLIGKKELALMRSGAFLVNTARGPVIDQKALTTALQSRRIAGFAADVLAAEPPSGRDVITALSNAFITPHTGSLTATTYRNMCVITVKNVLSLLEGGNIDPSFIFNRQALHA